MNLRKTLLLISVIIICFNSFGQNIKYKDYKNDFSTKNYNDKIKTEKYSPAIAAICNIMHPSVGYFYINEPRRGVLVLISKLAADGILLTGFFSTLTNIDYYSGTSNSEKIFYHGNTLMYSGMILSGIIHIWSIFDVVRIAKIKNLAYQENRFSVNFRPDIQVLNSNYVTCGLNVSFKF